MLLLRKRLRTIIFDMSENRPFIRYAGFWVRFIASLIDTFVIALPLTLFFSLFGNGSSLDFTDFFKAMQAAQAGNAQAAFIYLNAYSTNTMTQEILLQLLLAIIVILFWRKSGGATPGKKAMGIEVVDAKTLGAVSSAQGIVRFIGYIISALPLCAGFIMAAFRKDKRALHDLLADTCVIYKEEKDEKNSN
jgi:uncharacterized RDD family membrane protein YckC